MRKAILVPSEMVQGVKPEDETLGNLDNEMMRILYAKNIPMDIKIIQYNQVLQRYKTIQTERNKPFKVEIEEHTSSNFDISNILRGIPESKIPQAKLLTDFIMKQNRIIVEENGEITIDGSRIRNSNIIDLIHDLVRDRKTHLSPKGSEHLYDVLRRANMPLEYIGNKNRLQQFQQNHQAHAFRRPSGQWNE